ncbi:thioredoxin family protein [Youngiibacter fragilis]|uniref:Redox-active disulfide protein 2 n=1 Tax=Youngiibacter fragilis 232.1 TaxID=994573 RepID=V7ICD1_9CLOT|nr:thioredoxin family protein [Youngiibacter fragilis]ETA82527.1 redox-active disulfide protein 2 [Youngiibacter fragilis 232.1]
MEIKILGSGCKNCVNLAANAKEALDNLGVNGEIIKVTDFKEIASYGVMRTPGLVVDGKVVSSGKVLTAKEIAEIIKK